MKKTMHKVTRMIILIFLFGMSEISFAATSTNSPEVIAVKNNVQVSVSLSKTDINRLFVRGEKITAMNTPNGSLSAQNDDSGSLYVNVNQTTPFTVFITTDRERHFALLVLPKSEPGQTIELKPTDRDQPTPARFPHHSKNALKWEHHSPYEESMISLVRTVMQGQIPPGYTQVPLRAFSSVPALTELSTFLKKYPYLHAKIQSVYLGGEWAVRALLIENKSKKPLILTSNWFYQTGVKAVAIGKETLRAGETTPVFEVVDNA